jgi:hypothetical protein
MRSDTAAWAVGRLFGGALRDACFLTGDITLHSCSTLVVGAAGATVVHAGQGRSGGHSDQDDRWSHQRQDCDGQAHLTPSYDLLLGQGS